MNQVTINKSKLQTIVSDNKLKHNAIYEAAVEGYWVKAAQILKDKLALVEKQEKIDNNLGLAFPESHVEDYETVEKMLELSVDDNVTLENHEFQQYVMNKWAWRDKFLFANGGYIGLGTDTPTTKLKVASLSSGEYVVNKNTLKDF